MVVEAGGGGSGGGLSLHQQAKKTPQCLSRGRRAREEREDNRAEK